MSIKVDVLAVMDSAGCLLELHDENRAADLHLARAIVGDLIEAAHMAMVTASEACAGADSAMRRDAIARRDRLGVALARCGQADWEPKL